MSLFGKTDAVQMPLAGPAIPRRVSMGIGALARDDAAGNRYNPHPHLSAVVVVHARTNEQDFVEGEVAAMRPPEPARTEVARQTQARFVLKALTQPSETAVSRPVGMSGSRCSTSPGSVKRSTAHRCPTTSSTAARSLVRDRRQAGVCGAVYQMA